MRVLCWLCSHTCCRQSFTVDSRLLYDHRVSFNSLVLVSYSFYLTSPFSHIHCMLMHLLVCLSIHLRWIGLVFWVAIKYMLKQQV